MVEDGHVLPPPAGQVGQYPPAPLDHPHWVKCWADGGTLMKGRGSKETRGVYWSICCEAGTIAPAFVRCQHETGKYLTNNDAEWLAVREALRYIVEHHTDKPVVIYSDSMLIVQQFNGVWKTKFARHHRLRSECWTLRDQIKWVAVQWVPRAVNVDKLGH